MLCPNYNTMSRRASSSLLSVLPRTSSRHASTSSSYSSAPSSSSSLIEPLPTPSKPPLKTWFTSRPSLTSFVSELQSTLQDTRSSLYRSGYLTSIEQDIRTLPTTLGALGLPTEQQGVRWLAADDIASKLQVGKVRLAYYRRITGLLGELQALHPYLANERQLQYQKEKVGNLLARFRKQDSRLASVATTSGGTDLATGTAVTRKKPSYGFLSDKTGIAYGGGKKKSASAQAWLVPTLKPSTSGEEASIGQILVNNMPISGYFPTAAERSIILRPFSLTETVGRYNVFVLVSGGGVSSQAQAACVACARALAAADEAGISRAILSKGECDLGRGYNVQS